MTWGDREPESEDTYFKVVLCPHCEETTVVDTRWYDQRCDWVDTCGKLFDIENSKETDVTIEDLE